MNEKYVYLNVIEDGNTIPNKYIYEHRLIAEQIVGRKLFDEEHVHHIDGNIKNNEIDNLIVFRTNSDHTRYHKNGIMVKMSDNTYTSPMLNVCVKCGREICSTNKRRYCKKCQIEIFGTCQKTKVNKLPTKEDLSKLIDNKTSFCEMGRIYGISDNGIRKWCKKFSLI